MTDDELRLKIAELKGYKWYRLENPHCEHCGRGGKDRYHITTEGECMGTNWKLCEQPEIDYAINAISIASVPNWPGDIGAAWELAEEIHYGGYFLKLSTPFEAGGKYIAKVDRMGWGDNNPPPPGGWFEADTAARAIALAWISWKEVNS